MGCQAPLSIKYKQPIINKKGDWIYYFPADCGKCLPCLKKRKAQWSYRLENEMLHSVTAYFVTLTYNDDNLPPGNVVERQHHQSFIGLLKEYESWPQMEMRPDHSEGEFLRAARKTGEYANNYRYDDYPIRYYGICEFGGLSGRVHWHYLIFNVLDIRNIEKAWQCGNIQIDECNINTVDYVLKYMIKDRDSNIPDEKRECSFMSKGIGMQGITEEFIKQISEPENNQVINSRGHKVALPRIYRKRYMNKETLREKGKVISTIVQEQKAILDKKTIALGLDPDENHIVKVELDRKKLSESINRRQKL